MHGAGHEPRHLARSLSEGSRALDSPSIFFLGSGKSFIYRVCMQCMISMKDVIRMDPRDIEVYGTVKVGERGQIVIPSQARKTYDIKPGDLLLVVSSPMGDGVGLIKAEIVKELIEKMNRGLAGRYGKMGATPASKTRK